MICFLREICELIIEIINYKEIEKHYCANSESFSVNNTLSINNTATNNLKTFKAVFNPRLQALLFILNILHNDYAVNVKMYQYFSYSWNMCKVWEMLDHEYGLTVTQTTTNIDYSGPKKPKKHYENNGILVSVNIFNKYLSARTVNAFQT